MSLYILDTDTLSLYQDGHPGVCRRFLSHPLGDVVITVLSVEEQLSGWYTQVRQAKKQERLLWAYRRLAENVRFLSHLAILDFDEHALRGYEDLRRKKIKLGRTDLRIAAIAQEHGATLVSRNLRDFQRVPGLRVEDWTV